MNAWARGIPRPRIIDDWRHAARLHHEDLPRPRPASRRSAYPPRRRRAASRPRSSTPSLYVVNNHARLRADGRVAGALPAEDPDGRRGGALERHPLRARARTWGSPIGTIKVYVLVEQLEACFQLMEIRAALGPHFVGFNTGRWDYINSVADALAWDSVVRQPQHRRDHHDLRLHAALRGPGPARREHARRARPASRCGRAAWSRTSRWARPPASRAACSAPWPGAEREQREGASGKWVAHWKMVHIVRPVWEKVGQDNQRGREFPPLTYTRRGSRGAHAARAGAAHRSRRARPDQRGASSTATHSGRACRRPRSSPPTSSATTMCSI